MQNDFHKRFSLSLLTLGVASALALPLSAEENQNNTDDNNKVTITGSQIKGIDLENAQPLKIITSEDIKQSNAGSIAELLKDIGVFRGGEGSFNTSTSGALSNSTPAGMAAATLRGLGASSTLTLVNGRRVAASSFAASNVNFVDVNSIPLAAIDRIEILATGASAIYGADAVAGVVNYILKSDFDGAELDLIYADSAEKTDESKARISLTWGTSFDNGQITAYLDHYERNAFMYRDRGQTATTFSPATRGIYPAVYYADTFSGSAIVDPDCPNPIVYNSFGDEGCSYDPNQNFAVYPDLSVTAAGFSTSIDISDSLGFFADAQFSKSESTSYSSPASFEGLGGSSRAGIPLSHPNFPQDADFQNELYPWFDSDYDWSDYPWLNGPLWNINSDWVRFTGRFNTPRTIGIESEATRVVAGLKGFIDEWDWETAILYSTQESDQRAKGGIYDRVKFNAALWGSLCADGSVGCDPNVDGLWFNPFGGQNGNGNVLDVMSEDVRRVGESEVFGADFKISGEIGQINDQTISAAFGVEFRSEEISDNPSDKAVAQRDQNWIVDVMGFGSSRVTAKRDQVAAFAEFFVPLTDRFSLQIAGRYDDYEDFGSDFNPKVGFRYQPTESLLLRGSWSTSFRAPSLSQAGVGLRTTSFSARCLDSYASVFCDDNRATIGANSLEIGNALLAPETSRSVTLGTVISPTDDITITMDYWLFEHRDIIDVDVEQFLVNAVNGDTAMYCELVPEGEVGLAIDPSVCGADYAVNEFIPHTDLPALEAIAGSRSMLYRDSVFQLENTGSQETQGFDLTYTQYIDTETAGNFKVLIDITRINKFDRQRTAFADVEKLAGSFRYPELLASASLRWSGENAFARLSAVYTGHYLDEVDELTSFDLDYIESTQGIDAVPANDRRVPAWLVWNASYGYDITEDATIGFGIENLLDKDAPFVYGRYLNADMLNHDVMGRYYKVSYTQRF